MCVALLHLDFKEAFYAHPMLLLQSPVLIVILLRNIVTYIVNGVYKVSKIETVIIYVCIGLLIGFAIVRNIWRIV